MLLTSTEDPYASPEKTKPAEIAKLASSESSCKAAGKYTVEAKSHLPAPSAPNTILTRLLSTVETLEL